MKTPINPDNNERWSPEEAHALALSRGWARADIPIQSKGKYLHANRGDVWESLGWLWPCCPRSYVEFSSEQAKIRASRVLKIARATRQGDPGRTRHRPLTAGGETLVESALSYWDVLQDKKDAREIEEALKS